VQIFLQSDFIIAQHQEVSMRKDFQTRREHYKRLIELRQQRPDEPLSQFCRTHGISTWTYYFWRKKLCSDTPARVERAMAPFIPVRIQSAASMPHLLEILFPNGVVVRSGAELSRALLSNLAGIPRS
jgi:hypothetical protein